LLGYWEEEGDEGVLTMVSDGSRELGIWPAMTMNDGDGTSSTGESYGRRWNESM
jgi:hypothetical protein